MRALGAGVTMPMWLDDWIWEKSRVGGDEEEVVASWMDGWRRGVVKGEDSIVACFLGGLLAGLGGKDGTYGGFANGVTRNGGSESGHSGRAPRGGCFTR